VFLTHTYAGILWQDGGTNGNLETGVPSVFLVCSLCVPNTDGGTNGNLETARPHGPGLRDELFRSAQGTKTKFNKKRAFSVFF
jgi:hypothetical protein